MLNKTKTERWIFTDDEMSNDRKNCRGTDEFVARLKNHELGIIVYRNGMVTNRWEDGTVGVPDHVMVKADKQDTLFTPGGQSTDHWRDVQIMYDNRTMMEHAEAWWTQQYNIVPPRDTPGWEKMYQEWVNYAFRDME